jgi:cell division protein FtsI (penicillin-binding protein 3)
LAAAWNEGVIRARDTFINGKRFILGGREINDIHAEKGVKLFIRKTPREILTYSLNIGTAKIGLLLGKHKLYRYILDFGFGKPTGIELAGESGGIVRGVNKWSRSDEGIIPFGHSIAVTPIQLIQAINVVGNNGVLRKPTLIKSIFNSEDKIIWKNDLEAGDVQVISQGTAEAMLGMMKNVVDKGTGGAAALKGYSVSGKTGTAEKADLIHGGYLKNKYVSSFVGLVPANQPKISILVVIDTPGKGKYGGVVAAPCFKEIAQATVHYLGIPPDRERVLPIPAFP